MAVEYVRRGARVNAETTGEILRTGGGQCPGH